jgi:NADH-quinone oxidoreductase subunit N
MNPMLVKLATLGPEIALLAAACLCLMFGLAKGVAARKAPAWIAAVGLVLAGGLVLTGHGGTAAMTVYVKLAVAGVGLLLLMVAAALPEQWRQLQQAEAKPKFEPADVHRGEFFAFFLFSLTGVMLTAGADDLVWLFLALELTSLPTYVMVATAKERLNAQESAVKYFFLGAMAAAIFLYGFTLMYGATGFTTLADIRAVALHQLAHDQHLSPLLLMGIVLSVVGIAFKIAAVPMHFYAADVYEGAATPVTTMLAFVPKTAGFVALILILSVVGWPLPAPLAILLWVLAALTMTVGNVLGLLQSNVKRVLAYSSIAQSGYILVGLLAGPGAHDPTAAGVLTGGGLAAVLFYLVAYGLATIAAFAVLGCLTVRGEEAATFDDLAGLSKRHPTLAATMLLAVLSLIGLPPMIGFLGKIYLFGAAVEAGYTELVVVAVLNSAISAAYYLRIAKACYFDESIAGVEPVLLPAPARRLGALIAAVLALALGIFGGRLVDAARSAAPGALTVAAHQAQADTTLSQRR